MIATTSKPSIPNEHNGWKTEFSPSQKKYESYSSDDVINAYFKGVAKGLDGHRKILMEKFNGNLELAQDKGREFYQLIKGLNVKISNLYLKPGSITDFSLLFVMDENDYISDRVSEAYRKALEEKRKTNSETFKLDFSFMPDAGNVNSKKIVSDGYVFRYDEKRRKP